MVLGGGSTVGRRDLQAWEGWAEAGPRCGGWACVCSLVQLWRAGLWVLSSGDMLRHLIELSRQPFFMTHQNA